MVWVNILDMVEGLKGYRVTGLQSLKSSRVQCCAFEELKSYRVTEFEEFNAARSKSSRVQGLQGCRVTELFGGLGMGFEFAFEVFGELGEDLLAGFINFLISRKTYSRISNIEGNGRTGGELFGELLGPAALSIQFGKIGF